jgi:hypothetical protein
VGSLRTEHGRRLLVVLLVIIVAMIAGYVVTEFYVRPPEVVIDPAILKGSLVRLSYEELAEHPDEHRGKAVSYRGQVVRARGRQLTVQITPENMGFWNEVVHLDLMGEAAGSNPKAGDLVDFVGVANGIRKGLPIFGKDGAVPRIAVYELEVVERM